MNHKTHDICPQCSNPKDRRAAICHPCYSVNRSKVKDNHKECSQCKEVLPLENFRFRSRPNPTPRPKCRSCEAADQREYQKTVPREVKRSKKRQSYYGNLISAKRQLLRRYCNKIGINKEEIESIIDLFFIIERCEICNRHTDEAGTLNLDHCHKTNKFRSFICGNCNTGLGQFKDSQDNLQRAIDYLAKYS